jgi:hypothetical protein
MAPGFGHCCRKCILLRTASPRHPDRAAAPPRAELLLRGAAMRGEATARLSTRPCALHRAEVTGGILRAAFRMRRQARMINRIQTGAHPVR